MDNSNKQNYNNNQNENKKFHVNWSFCSDYYEVFGMSYEKTYCEERVKPEMSSNFHMLYPVLLLDLVQWQIYIYRQMHI